MKLVDEKFFASCRESGHSWRELLSEGGREIGRQCGKCLKVQRIKIRTCQRCQAETKSYLRRRNKFCIECRGRKVDAD